MAGTCLNAGPSGVFLFILAVPRASRTEVVDFREDRCRIRVKAPPVEGEANKVLIKALSKWFGLPQGSIKLVQGAQGKRKTFLLQGLTLGRAEEILRTLLPQGARTDE